MGIGGAIMFWGVNGMDGSWETVSEGGCWRRSREGRESVYYRCGTIQHNNTNLWFNATVGCRIQGVMFGSDFDGR